MFLDKKELDKISKWFNESNLTSATIEGTKDGDYKITLSKELPAALVTTPLTQTMPASHHLVHSPQGDAHVTESVATDHTASTAKEARETVTSPLVGTFYRAPGPDSPPFVQVGDIVKKGHVLCILEAMKVMNELEADYDMEIVSISMDNGDLVEFEQILFEVKSV